MDYTRIPSTLPEISLINDTPLNFVLKPARLEQFQIFLNDYPRNDKTTM